MRIFEAAIETSSGIRFEQLLAPTFQKAYVVASEEPIRRDGVVRGVNELETVEEREAGLAIVRERLAGARPFGYIADEQTIERLEGVEKALVASLHPRGAVA